MCPCDGNSGSARIRTSLLTVHRRWLWLSGARHMPSAHYLVPGSLHFVTLRPLIPSCPTPAPGTQKSDLFLYQFGGYFFMQFRM